ncbi:MAG: HNH endonuclease, partial [Solirubrobacterales bacterium]|nr:HNH endonuclease [Solirubrobacterales bacterium]
EVPAVRARIEASRPDERGQDHYRDPALRRELFERDEWRCRYCGDAVTPDTATLDHILPTSKGGTHVPKNLATACLMCNSIKSGRSYEDAAPDILASVQARRARS